MSYIYVNKNINDKIAMIAMSVSDYTALKKFYFFAYKFYIIWMDIQRVSNSFFFNLKELRLSDCFNSTGTRSHIFWV